MIPTNPDSPCVGVCKVATEGFCEGCGRYLHEIQDWLSYGPKQRISVKAIAKKRLIDHGYSEIESFNSRDSIV